MALGRTYDDQVCSVARALEVLGGVAPNVLAHRLHLLVEAGVLERVQYQRHPGR